MPKKDYYHPCITLFSLLIPVFSATETSFFLSNKAVLSDKYEDNYDKSDLNEITQKSVSYNEVSLDPSYYRPYDLSPLVFYTEDFPPFQYMENKTLKGISVDIVHEVL
ncbi:MAG: hypothetical protein JXA44_00055 [Methanospirillaceae archaeon]|nr:hypothetical protein [Methanospirillaceae archaeon]